MARQNVVGVMGPSRADTALAETAERLGRGIAGMGHVTLTGGRPEGVMQSALRGARKAGGRTIAILPGADRNEASRHADIVIATGMGSGRNVINVLSCDVVVACGMGAGTLSEIALAIKSGRPVVALHPGKARAALEELGGERLVTVDTPAAALDAVKWYMKER